MRKKRTRSPEVGPTAGDPLQDASTHQLRHAVQAEGAEIVATTAVLEEESPELTLPVPLSMPPELAALLEQVSGLSVERARLGKAFLPSALELGQRLLGVTDYVPNECWESWVTAQTPLDVGEALAMVLFATGRDGLAARMTPAVGVGLTEIVRAFKDLTNSFDEAQYSLKAPKTI